MTRALTTAGLLIVAWSITGTDPPRTYAWALGLTLVMIAYARHIDHKDERDRRADWNRRHNR